MEGKIYVNSVDDTPSTPLILYDLQLKSHIDHFIFTLFPYGIFFNFQEFPILCQTCLGDNPYIRMVSLHNVNMLFKETEICHECRMRSYMCHEV